MVNDRWASSLRRHWRAVKRDWRRDCIIWPVIFNPSHERYTDNRCLAPWCCNNWRQCLSDWSLAKNVGHVLKRSCKVHTSYFTWCNRDVESACRLEIVIDWMLNSNTQFWGDSRDMWFLCKYCKPVLCPRWHLGYEIWSNWHLFYLEGRVVWIAIRWLWAGVETHLNFNKSWHCRRYIKPSGSWMAVYRCDINRISYCIENRFIFKLKHNIHSECSFTYALSVRVYTVKPDVSQDPNIHNTRKAWSIGHCCHFESTCWHLSHCRDIDQLLYPKNVDYRTYIKQRIVEHWSLTQLTRHWYGENVSLENKSNRDK